MTASFSHVGVVAHDVDRLAAFYVRVFGCEQSGPRRDLSGGPLERGMGLRAVHVRGVHLSLPPLPTAADGVPAPVLEIFALDAVTASVAAVDRTGLMHLAFRVEHIEESVDALLAAGGTLLGEIARVEVDGVGAARFVYARDPEGNIVELQEWAAGTNGAGVR